MKKRKVEEGIVFCIPLFMPKDDWDLKIKLDEKDNNKTFVFGRVIEDGRGSGILVEIFNKTGDINTKIDEIIESPLLFKPLYIFWKGISKKRWKTIGQTPNYDKFEDSNYASIRIVFGFGDDMRIHNYGTKEETKVKREEALNYEFAQTWFPIDLENRIIEKINSIKIS